MTVRLKITVRVLVVLAVLAGAAGYVLGMYYSDNKKPNFTQEYVLYVRPETTVQQVVDSLQLRAVEKAKIDCAKQLFNKMSNSKVRYENVTNYQDLLDKMNTLA